MSDSTSASQVPAQMEGKVSTGQVCDWCSLPGPFLRTCVLNSNFKNDITFDELVGKWN